MNRVFPEVKAKYARTVCQANMVEMTALANPRTCMLFGVLVEAESTAPYCKPWLRNAPGAVVPL